jgi:pilus assembly protein CpaB
MATPKTTATLIGIVAVFFAGLAAYLVYDYLVAKEQESKQARMDVQRIAVAAIDMDYGTMIKPDHVKLADWPKTNLPPGHKTSVESLSNRLTTTTVKAGSPILESNLAPADTEGGMMQYLIPPGSRAITVAVNEVVGVAGFVLPNSIVDVVATVNSPSSSSRDQRVSKIILQNVKVLAVGQILEQKEGKPVVVPTVTLQAKPEDAEKLALASENKVQLILRHMGDETEVATKGATIASLLGGPPPAKPASTSSPTKSYRPAPAKAEYVEVIKGGERSKVQTK